MLTIRESFSLYLSPSLASKRERRGSKSERGSERQVERDGSESLLKRSGAALSLSLSPVLPSSASLLEMCCLRLAKRERERRAWKQMNSNHIQIRIHTTITIAARFAASFFSLALFPPHPQERERGIRRQTQSSLISKSSHTHIHAHSF